MDRKGIVGLIVTVICFVSWQIYVSKATQRAQLAQQEVAAQAAAVAAKPAEPGTAEGAPLPAGAATPAQAVPVKPVAEKIEEKQSVIASPSVEYRFTNLGGGIASAKLLNQSGEKGDRIILNEFGQLPIGASSEVAGDSAKVPYTIQANEGAGEVTFGRIDGRMLRTTKKYTVLKGEGEEYKIRLDLSLSNEGAEPLALPSYFIHTGSAAPIHQRDLPTYTGYHFLSGGDDKFIDANWFNGGGFLIFNRHPAAATFEEYREKVRWAGVTNQYYTSLVTPIIDDRASSDVQAKYFGAQAWARRSVISDAAWLESGHSLEGKGSAERFAVEGALGLSKLVLKPGETFTHSFNIYTGPLEYRRLKALGNSETEMMNFGMFAIISKTLLASMNALKGWLGSYAWAIVVLTLIIKTLLWPLQNKATNSMKQMQALQPKMTALREKYKDNPTQMNVELMQLYKEYNINPLGGCWPMFIQIPIFFGFYNMLGRAVELRNSTFLWVQDLSQPDTVAHFLGFPVNVLPLCMAGTMLVQMAIQPKSGDQTQQKMMMFMPLIFVFFCYNFASALALYWTVQNLFSIVQLLLTRNQAAPTLMKAPAKKKVRL